MANYEISHDYGSSNTFEQDVEVYVSKKKAEGITVEFGRNDTASWKKPTTSEATDFTYQYFKYDGHIWLQQLEGNLITLGVSEAYKFRKNINDNYTLLQSNAQIIKSNVDKLDKSLATVARTALTTDITPTPERGFVSDTERKRWNTKTWIDLSKPAGSEGTILQYTDGESSSPVDITSYFKDVVSTANIPKNTSDLDYNSSFIEGSKYEDQSLVYVTNATIKEVTTDNSVSGYNYRKTIELAGCNANLTPVVSFSQADILSGEYSPIAESFNGGVYIWGKTAKNNTVIPLVYAIKSSTITS